MAVELVMPRLSESMEEGTIVSWLVPDGSPVNQGDEIAEIETDKATVPYEAPEMGVLRILVPEGSTLKLGQPIGLIDDLVPLPGGQSVAPPGTGAATRGGQVPGPRAPESDPATASYELQPDLHAPHTVHASAPPPRRDAAWSPAWGPQPAATRAGQPAPVPVEAFEPEDEGETTEFAALPPEAAPGSAAPAPADRAAVLADDGSAGIGPLFAGVTPDEAAADAATIAEATEPELAAMPWVDATLGSRPAAGQGATPAAVPAQPAAPTPAEPASQTPAGDDRRFSPDELIAPATLAPRPPELQPTASGATRIPASPVARRLAQELGIDLATIEGTGPEGRVVRADIEAAQATGAARPPKQAAAVPTTASEFTPPVDDARAAAPIPAAEPAEDGAAPAEASADAATTSTDPADPAVAEPAEQTAAAEVNPAATATDSPRAESPTPTEDTPSVVVGDDAEALVEAAVQAAAVLAEAPGEVVVGSPQEAADADDEEPAADAPTEAGDEPDAHPEPAAGPQLEAVPPIAEATPDPGAESPSSVEADSGDTPDAPADPVVVPEPSGTPDASSTAASADPGTASRVLPAAQPGGGKGEPTVVQLTRQQQTVARRMAESKATIPDFQTVVEVDAAPLLALRAELRTTRPDLPAPSVNDLLVKATAVALRAFPALNGAYRDGRLEHYPKVNVGIAVDAGELLFVPVVHDADQLSVSQIAARTDEVVGKARDGSLRPPDIASATFTLTNLGTHGVERLTAVITPGQAAMLTAGAITARPVVRDGAVVPGQVLVLTLIADHRAVYGAEAARFLGRVRELLEHPTSLLA